MRLRTEDNILGRNELGRVSYFEDSSYYPFNVDSFVVADLNSSNRFGIVLPGLRRFSLKPQVQCFR